MYYIATDYEEWAVEYVCIDIVPGQYYVDSVTILGREPQLDEGTVELVSTLIANSDIEYEFENLIFVNQCAICPFNTVPETPAQ